MRGLQASVAMGATHFNWREDVKRLVRRFERRYATKGNSYDDHPHGWSLDDRSVDFWAPAGRGAPIGEADGWRIFIRLRRRRRPPHWRWIIWRGTIYYPSGFEEPYWDLDDLHYDHVHVTFW